MNWHQIIPIENHRINDLQTLKIHLKGWKVQFSIEFDSLNGICVSPNCIICTIFSQFRYCFPKNRLFLVKIGLIFEFSNQNPGAFKFIPGVKLPNYTPTLLEYTLMQLPLPQHYTINHLHAICFKIQAVSLVQVKLEDI